MDSLVRSEFCSMTGRPLRTGFAEYILLISKWRPATIDFISPLKESPPSQSCGRKLCTSKRFAIRDANGYRPPETGLAADTCDTGTLLRFRCRIEYYTPHFQQLGIISSPPSGLGPHGRWTFLPGAETIVTSNPCILQKLIAIKLGRYAALRGVGA